MPTVYDTLSRIDEMEQYLQPSPGSFLPDLKIIHSNTEFCEWKEQALFFLRSVKNSPIVNETIDLLQNGFNSGWSDEKDFLALKSKIHVILENKEITLDYVDNHTKANDGPQKLKKGLIVKTTFDSYELIEQVGSGGNGTVFSAKTTDGEKCAIKFIDQSCGKTKFKRFKNEIHFCETHPHKNIVQIIDRGYAKVGDKDYSFYVMPLYANTLKAKIKAGVPADEATAIFCGILEGLKYAHSLNTIHRDIKPENILFTEGSSEPIICDFGIAHFAEEDLLTAVETKDAERLCNYNYCAPEQKKKDSGVFAQSDVYAAALILNEMFTGEIPQAPGYKTIESVNPEYKYLDEVLEKILLQDPEERLYPEDNIIMEMRLRAEENKRVLELDKLRQTQLQLADPGTFLAKIESKDFDDGHLVFIFDQALPPKWISIIKQGSFSCMEMGGYERSSLIRLGQNKLGLKLRGRERKETLRDIVNYMNGWVQNTNELYNTQIHEQLERELRKREEERKAAIEKLENDRRLSSIISNL